MKRKLMVMTAIAVLSLTGATVAHGDAVTQPPVEVRAGTYVLDPAHGKITWSVDHLGFSTYFGQFSGVAATLHLDSANPAASRLEASVAMASVGTFSEGLDNHLRTADFFDVANHPAATFRATAIRLTDADSADITGNLTLRGVTRPIIFQADFNKAAVSPGDNVYTIGFDGRAKIRRSEFGMNYGLPALGDEVTLHLEAEFKLQPQS